MEGSPMKPQDVVNTAEGRWQATNNILICATLNYARISAIAATLLATTGCRAPWNGGAADPSFDRLLQTENKHQAALHSANPMHNSLAANQVIQRRPGSNAAARFDSSSDEFEEFAGRAAESATAQSAEEFDDSAGDVDSQLQLLKRTQLALKRSSENAVAPPPENLLAKRDSRKASETTHSSRAHKPAQDDQSEDEVVFRLNDETMEPAAPNANKRRNASRNVAAKVSHLPEEAEDLESDVVPAAFDQGSQRRPDQPQTSAKLPADATQPMEELTWQQHLQEALRQLKDGNGDSLASPTEKTRREVIARLLSLSLNDREAMLAELSDLQPHEQDYFSHQLSALFDAVDPEANPVSSRKWSLTMLNQRKANAHLAALSNLEITNISFCSEVIDFGVTSPFASYKFTPDQEVLLYLELDNFVSEKSKDGKGFETQLQGSYEIVDSNGRRVADQMLPADSHICKNIRRDYFIAYRVYMPSKIGPGNYTMRLTIEDLKGKKFGQSEIQFQIQ
jgi:hypothetical protein